MSDDLHQYRVSMMRGGSQRSEDDVYVTARNEGEAMRKAEQMKPGYKACNAYEEDDD